MINYDWRYKTLGTFDVPFDDSKISSILRYDAKIVSSRREKYISRNFSQYKICTNLWLLLLDDLCGTDARLYVEHEIVHRGLIGAIGFCSKAANEIISGTATGPEYAYLIDAMKLAPIEKQLQCLRFPKRFTPWGIDLLDAEKLASFKALCVRDSGERLARNSKGGSYLYSDQICVKGNTPDPCRYRDIPHTYVYRKLRDIISKILKGYKSPKFGAPVHSRKTGKIKPTTPLHYSTGATQDVCTCTFCKELALSIIEGNGRLGFNPPTVDLTPYPRSEWGRLLRTPSGDPVRGYIRGKEFYAVTPTLVPKDYKGPRIIAPERFDRQCYMKAVADEVERCINRNGFASAIPLHDQGVNQDAARTGSITGSIATIDLSHASDSVTKEIVWNIFPTIILRDFYHLMPDYVIINKEILPLQIFGTMGSALTFMVESIVFYAIAQLGHEMYEAFADAPLSCNPTAYGDDITCASEAAPTVIDILSLLGFEVNDDKSFYSGYYRESCGVEYYKGYELTSLYWPRRDMSDGSTHFDTWKGTYDSLASSWISLSNRIYTLTSPLHHVCNAHNYIRLWLTSEFKVVCTPPQYAYEGMLLGDNLTPRCIDLLNGKRFTTTWEEYAKHPSWRFLCTTADKKDYNLVSSKCDCWCNRMEGSDRVVWWRSHTYDSLLKEGPKYLSELDKLLKVSSPTTPYMEAVSAVSLGFLTSYRG